MSDDLLVLPATCQTHGGTPGFTNFAIRNVRGGVQFDSHAVGGCLVTVPEEEARRLHAALGEWL
jgi:hypothetical protein